MIGRPALPLLQLLAGLCTLATASCSVEVDVKNITITRRDVRFDGIPAIAPGVPVATKQSFDLTSSTVAWSKDLNANVHAVKVRLHAVDGVDNLDFIQSAQVELASPGRSQGAVEIMRFERAADAASSPDLEVTNLQPIDITAAWSSQRMRIDIAVAGLLPTQAWSIDVALNLSGQIKYSP